MQTSNIVNIDLKMYFRSLMEQWKAVAAVAVILALILPSLMSIKEISDSKKAKKAYDELRSVPVETMIDNLSDTERQNVVTAFDQELIISRNTSDLVFDPTDEGSMDKYILDSNNLKTFMNNHEALLNTLTDRERSVLDILMADSGLKEDTPVTVASFHLSLKWMAAGFILGMILYAFCYLAAIVFSSKVQNPRALDETLGIRDFGTVSEYEYKGFSFFMHCKLLYRFHNKKNDISVAADRVVSSVKAACSYNDVKKLVVVSTGEPSLYSSKAGKLMDKLGKMEGVKVISAGDDMEGQLLEDNTSVLILTGANKTRYEELIRIRNVCGYYDRKVLGGIYLI